MNLDINFQFVGLLSILSFVVSLVCVPWLINRLDICFFTLQSHEQRIRKRREQHLLLMVVIMIIRHCVGFILLAIGIALLFMPGQGILTILIALALMDFPGKYRFITTIVKQKQVRLILDWIRRKGGRQPFIFEGDSL